MVLDKKTLPWRVPAHRHELGVADHRVADHRKRRHDFGHEW